MVPSSAPCPRRPRCAHRRRLRRAEPERTSAGPPSVMSGHPRTLPVVRPCLRHPREKYGASDVHAMLPSLRPLKPPSEARGRRRSSPSWRTATPSVRRYAARLGRVTGGALRITELQCEPPPGRIRLYFRGRSAQTGCSCLRGGWTVIEQDEQTDSLRGSVRKVRAPSTLTGRLWTVLSETFGHPFTRSVV